MRSWAEEELRTMETRDVRRPRRLAVILETLVRRPGRSLPQTFRSKAELNATYYALSSEHILPEEILASHRNATVARLQVHPLVIVPNDTTSLDYTTHESVFGLGHLETKSQMGLFAHTAIAVTPNGVMLGTLHQQTWTRDPEAFGKKHTRRQRTTDQKESQKWLATVETVQRAVPETTTAVVTGDREADLYALFALPREPHIQLLVRSAQNRRVEGEHRLLQDAVRAVLPCGKLTLELRSADHRVVRTAELTLRCTTVSILPPVDAPKKSLHPVEIQAILAEEENPPAGVKEPLSWLLLTTLPVGSVGEAVQIVNYYRLRWMVERFHFVLKSGCGIEKLQLGSLDALVTALALSNIVAWKLLNLTYLARVEPDISCEVVFEQAEWEALCCHAKQTAKPPKKPPTLREAARLVAQLGGFLGRKCDGEPGVKTIWQGLILLDQAVAMYTIMRGIAPPRDSLQTFRER